MTTCDSVFKGKYALITGAGNGMGRCITVNLVRRGCHVFAVDLQQSAVDETIKQAGDASLITPVVLDIGDWERTKTVLESLVREHPVSYLVNCAAVFRPEPFGHLEEAVIDKHFNVNVKAIINVSQVVTERMKAAGLAGSVVHISSVGSKHAAPNTSVYSVTKAAVDHLTRCMAVELAQHKIRVNSINPSLANTSFSLLNPEETAAIRDMILATIPMHRLVEVQEIADAALFLLADNNGMVTGQNLCVDGGRSCV